MDIFEAVALFFSLGLSVGSLYGLRLGISVGDSRAKQEAIVYGAAEVKKNDLGEAVFLWIDGASLHSHLKDHRTQESEDCEEEK